MICKSAQKSSWLQLAWVVALMVYLIVPNAAYGQECVGESGNTFEGVEIVEYYTDITEWDLVNSSGERLSGFRTILQQDRANFHVFGVREGITLEDGNYHEFEADKFFTTLQRRQIFQEATIVSYCNDQGETHLKTLIQEIERARLNGVLMVKAYKRPSGDYVIFISLVG